MANLNNDFPVPLSVFSAVIKNTPDEIWLRLLQVSKGNEKHTEVEWMLILNSFRTQKA